MLAADKQRRPLTGPQRRALSQAYDDALAAAVEAQVVKDAPLPLPALPVGTHPGTARCLVRRGLVADGRLTPLGVEVCRLIAYYAARRTRTGAPIMPPATWRR